jgi:hypothetical protein
MSITEAAQRVQHSAYPQAYADHEAEGRAFASALTGQSPAALSCVLKRATAAGDPGLVQAQLKAAYPALDSSADGRTVQVRAAGDTGWAVAQWAVATAGELQIESVAFAGRVWSRAGGGWAADSSADGTVVITLAASS